MTSKQKPPDSLAYNECGMQNSLHRHAPGSSLQPETRTPKKAGHRRARCTRKSPLPLLPSGPGGVGGNALRGADARLS
jgi:hypothetical protein